MDIIVCLKRVPDTGVRIEIERNGIEIKTDIPWILNPYDEFAVEEAIKIKERFGGTVTLITAGAEGGEEILKKGIASGADSAVYIKDLLLKNLDSFGIAWVLSKVISNMKFNLMLCGKQGTDRDEGITGSALAGLLNIPIISAIKELKVFPEKKYIEALREMDGDMESVKIPMPAILTAHKGLNEPRYPSLSGIMRAKRQEIKYIGINSQGIKKEGFLKEISKRESLSYPVFMRKGIILNGDIKEQVKGAVEFIRDEVKILDSGTWRI